MAELAALLAYDLCLLRTGRRAISTRIRDCWHAHPYAMSACAVALIFHLTRTEQLARLDPLSRIADRIA